MTIGYLRSRPGRAAALLLIAFALAGAPVCSAQSRQGSRSELSAIADREISFSTDEGTWMSIDLSPDGETIVFDLLGDLYTLPASGGRATRITSGMAFDAQPRFSPDGRRIAFVSDRGGDNGVWIVDADGGSPRPLTQDTGTLVSPFWTPDGRHLLASRVRGPLLIYDVETGHGTPLRNGSLDNWVLGASGTADGRHVFYARALQPGSTASRSWGLFRLNRETGAEDLIVRPVGGALRPMPLGDGSTVIYATMMDGQTGLRLRNLHSGNDRWLIYPIQRDILGLSSLNTDVLPGYAIARDGRSILVAYNGKIHRIRIRDGHDEIIPFQAEVSLQLGPDLHVSARVEDGPTVRPRFMQGAVASPDGRRIAFSMMGAIYVQSLGRGTARLVTATATDDLGLPMWAFQPAWSPDGMWLCYVTRSREGAFVYKVRADGVTGPTRLTPLASYYRDPVWSPDGQSVIALRSTLNIDEVLTRAYFSREDLDLIRTSASGGEPSLVMRSPPGTRPHFTADGSRIYLSAAPDVFSVSLDGTSVRNELHVQFDGASATTFDPANGLPFGARIEVSPDRRHALVLARQNLYLVDVSSAAAPPRIDLTRADQSWRIVHRGGVDQFSWSQDSRSISWSVGANFFRRRVDRAGSLRNGPAEVFHATPTFSRDRPRGTVVLRNARVITMRGDEVIDHADIIVTDNRISAVGVTGSVSYPHGTRVIDLTGKTVVPGFIGTHEHWMPRLGTPVLDAQPWNMAAALAFGMTSAFDPQTQTGDMFAYQDMAETGRILGPRLFSTGPGIVMSNTTGFPDVLNALAQYRDAYRTNTVKAYWLPDRRRQQYMVRALHLLGLMSTTEGGFDYFRDLTFAIDGMTGLEHLLPVIGLHRDVLELFSRSGITYSPTLGTGVYGGDAYSYFMNEEGFHNNAKVRRFTPHSVVDGQSRLMSIPASWRLFPRYAADVARMIRAGVNVTVGAHGEIPTLGFHWNLEAMAAGGVTSMEVLRAATINGARAIGYAQDLGSIEPGKLADLVVLNGNPLEDIRNTQNIQYVMQNGRLYVGDTLAEIWPNQREMHPQFRYDLPGDSR